MLKYKLCALAGTVVMGVGSFMACLADSSTCVAAGNILLILSILVMIYGYAKWQP